MPFIAIVMLLLAAIISSIGSNYFQHYYSSNYSVLTKMKEKLNYTSIQETRRNFLIRSVLCCLLAI